MMITSVLIVETFASEHPIHLRVRFSVALTCHTVGGERKTEIL